MCKRVLCAQEPDHRFFCYFPEILSLFFSVDGRGRERPLTSPGRTGQVNCQKALCLCDTAYMLSFANTALAVNFSRVMSRAFFSGVHRRLYRYFLQPALLTESRHPHTACHSSFIHSLCLMCDVMSYRCQQAATCVFLLLETWTTARYLSTSKMCPEGLQLLARQENTPVSHLEGAIATNS